MTQDDALRGSQVKIRPGVTFRVAHSPGHDPALVFLHGALGQRFNWRIQYDAARRKGLQAVAYDLAGHGQSSAYGRYSAGRHSRDLRRLLDHLGIDNPILCGHSYGVPIALEYANRYPVQGLILVAGGTHNLSPWWEPPVVGWMEVIGRHWFHSPFLQQLALRLMGMAARPDVEQFARESPIPTALEPYRSMGGFWGYNALRRPELLRWRQVPALVMSGGRDPVFTRMMAEQLAEQFVSSHHIHMHESGHLLMAEEPLLFNRAIEDWLEAQGFA